MKIVLTLDEAELRKIIAEHLKANGYKVAAESIVWDFTYDGQYEDQEVKTVGVKVEIVPREAE